MSGSSQFLGRKEVKIELIFGAGQGPVHKLSNLFYNERQKLKGTGLVFFTVRVFYYCYNLKWSKSLGYKKYNVVFMLSMIGWKFQADKITQKVASTF